MSALDVGLLVGIPVGVTAILFGIAKLNGSTLSDFKTWQLILASLHLCFAFTMLGLTASNEAWVVNVNVQYNVWDVNDAGSCSDASPCSIDLAVKNVGEFQTTYLVPFFSIVSGMHHLVAAASYYLTGTGGFYNSAVESGVNWVRWIDYGISSSLMIVVLDVLFVAPPDLRSLLYAALLQSFVILAGYSSDVARTENRFSEAKTIFFVASLLYSAFFAMQFAVFGLGTEESDAPAVVYIFVGFIAITFASFAVVQILFTRMEAKLDQKTDKLELRYKQEVWFSVLSFWAKIPLLSTFYFGLTTRSSNSIQVRNPITTSTPVPTTTTTSDDTQFEQYIPFMVTLILCISLGIVMICKVAAPGSGNAAPLSGNYKRI